MRRAANVSCDIPRCIERLETRRLLAAGALDTSFSGDGKATFPSSLLSAADVAVQSDGKAVVVGTFSQSASNTQVALARYNLDGTADPTFGTQGIVLSQISNVGESLARAVAIAPDGKIVVVGDARINDGIFGATEPELAVARFNADGSPDLSFNGSGRRTFDLGDFDSFTHGHDIVIQSDGKIVVVGMTYKAPDPDYFAIRLNVNGTLDATFDGDGKRTFGMGEDDTAVAVKIDAGNIFIAGKVEGSTTTVGILKLNSSGTKLSSFSGDGEAFFALPGRAQTVVKDILVQSGSRLVIAGNSIGLDGKNDFFIARFAADGTIDKTFGPNGNGFQVIDLGGDDVAEGITTAPGGGFIVSGGSGGMAAVKFTDNGLIDTTFGSAGKVKLGFGGVANIASGPGRRVMLAGGASFATARLLMGGARLVTIGALNDSVTEGSTTDLGSLFVGRVERLSTPTRVFLSITGTANSSQIPTLRDYTIPGLVIPIITIGQTTDLRPYVDIPANQTFVILTVTARNDTAIEGLETLNFDIRPDASYEIGTPARAEFDIFDDDGTQTAVSPSDDAYVRDGGGAATNFGSAVDLQVKTSTAGLNRLAYIKFNIASFGVVEKARLQLFGKLSDSQNSNVVVDIFPVSNTTWSNSAINFNNKPAPGATALGSVTITDTALRLYEFDVGSYVKQETALGHGFVSFMLKSRSTTESFVSFNSQNAATGQPKMLLVSPLSVGIFSNTPVPRSAKVGDEVKIDVTWTVPRGGWRQLSSIDLLLRDKRDPGDFVLLRFDEKTSSFVVKDQSRDGLVTLVNQDSVFHATGPTSPIVTTTFAFQIGPASAHKTLALYLLAANDEARQSGPDFIGLIRVPGARAWHDHREHRPRFGWFESAGSIC